MSSLFLADGPSDIIQKTVTQVDIVSMQFLSQIFFVKQITVTILQNSRNLWVPPKQAMFDHFRSEKTSLSKHLGSLSLNIFNVQKILVVVTIASCEGRGTTQTIPFKRDFPLAGCCRHLTFTPVGQKKLRYYLCPNTNNAWNLAVPPKKSKTHTYI